MGPSLVGVRGRGRGVVWYGACPKSELLIQVTQDKFSSQKSLVNVLPLPLTGLREGSLSSSRFWTPLAPYEFGDLIRFSPLSYPLFLILVGSYRVTGGR